MEGNPMGDPRMDQSSSHTTDSTPKQIEVKSKESDRGQKLTITVTVKDRLLQGLTDAAKEKALTPNQYVRETIEKALIKEGHLPDWWFSRQF